MRLHHMHAYHLFLIRCALYTPSIIGMDTRHSHHVLMDSPLSLNPQQTHLLGFTVSRLQLVAHLVTFTVGMHAGYSVTAPPYTLLMSLLLRFTTVLLFKSSFLLNFLVFIGLSSKVDIVVGMFHNSNKLQL